MIVTWIGLLALTLQQPPDGGSSRKPEPIESERVAALEEALRGVVLAKVPKPLAKGQSRWGEQTATPNGVKWNGKGLIKKPELQYGDKNHGTWRKYEVDLLEP